MVQDASVVLNGLKVDDDRGGGGTTGAGGGSDDSGTGLRVEVGGGGRKVGGEVGPVWGVASACGGDG